VDHADSSLNIEEGRVYTAADATQPHPTLLWREGEMVYYLVGDAMPNVQQAATVLRSAT
jgi:hypothetical protein